METAFPFHSSAPETGIYHTHPRCRIAQSIAADSRVAGTGDNRRECPFCFLLAQFQVNRALRWHLPGQGPGAAATAAAPERSYRS